MLIAAGLGVLGCPGVGGPAGPSMPPAESYDAPSNFEGRWHGEVDGQIGTLTIKPLGPARYRGLFEGESVEVEYVLAMEQDMVAQGEGTIPGNRTTFKWADGRGSEGEGWLLINREDSALTGAFGEQGMIERPWTFIRAE